MRDGRVLHVLRLDNFNEVFVSITEGSLSNGISSCVEDRVQLFFEWTGELAAVCACGVFGLIGFVIYLACQTDNFRTARVVRNSIMSIHGCSEIELVESVVQREASNLTRAPTLSTHISA